MHNMELIKPLIYFVTTRTQKLKIKSYGTPSYKRFIVSGVGIRRSKSSNDGVVKLEINLFVIDIH